RLEFRLREPVGAPAPPPEAGLVIEPARVAEAARVLARAFEGEDDPVTLGRRLEAALGAGRDAWPLAAIRALWDALWPLEPARPGPQELREMWQAIGSCERLPAATRAELGALLVNDAERGRASEQELWALARLGARVPIYGPLNCVVPRDAAGAWAERLLAADWPRAAAYAFALAQIARATGDRQRDLEGAL